MIRLYRVFADMVRKYVGAWLRVARELGDIVSSVRKLGRYYAENAVLLNKVHNTNIVEIGRVSVSKLERPLRKAIEGD